MQLCTLKQNNNFITQIATFRIWHRVIHLTFLCLMSSSVTWFNTAYVSKVQNLHGYNAVQEILDCIVCKGDTEQKQVGYD